MQNEIGVIDVGTNSILALGLSRSGIILFNDYKISELGKGMHLSDDYLQTEKINDAFEIITTFVKELRSLKIKEIQVVGTSASRDAKNIQILIDKIKTLKIDYQIISGGEEAYYTYLGALNLFKNPRNKNFVMMDIGGGSTEVIFGTGNEIKYKKSFQLGVLRLKSIMDKIQLNSEDEKAISNHINQFFSKIPNQFKDDIFVGIGGTFTTIAAIFLKLKNYNPDLVNGLCLNLKEITNQYNRINALNLDERKAVEGLEFKRAPLIHIGLRIVIEFMQNRKINTLHFTDFGLRFGVAKNYFKST